MVDYVIYVNVSFSFCFNFAFSVLCKNIYLAWYSLYKGFNLRDLMNITDLLVVCTNKTSCSLLSNTRVIFHIHVTPVALD